MKKYGVPLLLWVLTLGSALAAQEVPGDREPPDPGAGRIYRIRSVDFEIKGRSRPFALMEKGEFRIGEELQGEAELERYIARKWQLLTNQRVLESVEITYALGEAEENAEGVLIPVDLSVRVTDTWNIIALPYPKYDDNTGFELILKARDYNFLGTMNALRGDLGYKRSEDGKNSFVFEIDSDTPFRAWGFTWNVNFDHSFSYTPDAPLYYKNTTGLSMELPFRRSQFTFGFNEYVIFNEENSDDDKPLHGPRFEGGFMASELYALWKIPTGLALGDFGELCYTPKFSGRINYRPGGTVDELRKGPSLTGSHSLGFSRVDWIGNYRRGLDVSVENSNGYNFYKFRWNRNITFNALGHLPLSKLFGISGRLRLRTWFDDPLTGAGDDLRGILNRAVQAQTMLSFSLDLPFRLIRFYPSELLNNPKLRFFNFELHSAPFVDLALVNNRGENKFLSSGGLELIVFPAFMRSLYLRVSLGYNLREFAETGSLPGGDNRELFIGLGHHY